MSEAKLTPEDYLEAVANPFTGVKRSLGYYYFILQVGPRRFCIGECYEEGDTMQKWALDCWQQLINASQGLPSKLTEEARG